MIIIKSWQVITRTINSKYLKPFSVITVPVNLLRIKFKCRTPTLLILHYSETQIVFGEKSKCVQLDFTRTCFFIQVEKGKSTEKQSPLSKRKYYYTYSPTINTFLPLAHKSSTNYAYEPLGKKSSSYVSLNVKEFNSTKNVLNNT